VLARDRARLELAMLLFADPLTPFALQAEENAALPTFAEIEKAAMAHNPMLAGALAALQQSDAEVLGSKGAYLPDLALNFNYGIDATTLATKAPFDADEGRNPRNLGYSIAATIDIPVWDWFSTERRVRQSEIRRDAVRVALTAAQKRLIVDLKEDYAEAQAAQNQIASLEETARTAEESLRLTRLRYSSGEATALEVVDAETTLYSAQTAQEDGRVRYEQALSSLQILTGAL
jgi:outer membrane protein TolC